MTDPKPAAAPGAEWNARAYHRLSSPMQNWGEVLVERLSLRGDETVLDLGCGSGKLTKFLLRRLPHGRVIAIDRSANMLEASSPSSAARSTICRPRSTSSTCTRWPTWPSATPRCIG
jgi:trans-aconitate methyltransferase